MIYILKNRSEILLTLYLVIFSLLKPLLLNNLGSSTFILAIATGLIIGTWILFEIICKKNITISYKHLLFIIIIYLLLFCEMILRPNSMNGDIIYKFTIYGAIPILLCSKVSNYKNLLGYYAIFSIINGIIYFFEPLNNYKTSGNYMTFGFSQMLPAFAGSIIMFNIFKKKYGIMLAVMFFIQMFLYANKGATICAICIFVISYIFFNKKKGIILKRLFIVIFLLLMILFNLETVVEGLIQIIEGINMETYSLTTFLNMLQDNENNVYRARTDIWQNAIHLFTEKPIFGYGVGYFESNYNGYTHNFFLDIAVSSGLFGVILVVMALILSIKRVVKLQDNYKKYFLIIMLAISFIPMMFSLTYWTVMTFWLYFAIVFCSKDEDFNINGERYENFDR